MRHALLMTALLVAAALSGCFGFSDDSNPAPGTSYKETGRTVHLKATVLDLLQKDVYPGLEANMWAFCFEAANPDDAYSVAAIEYLPEPTMPSSSVWDGKCSVPGPTLRVQQGDRVIIDFLNDHVHPHTIHWHGQYVPNDSDGVPGSTQDSVKPAEAYRYEFIAERAGTLWYHCHVDTQFHVMQGLYGMFIVEPQDNNLEPDVDRDQVLVLGTLKRDLVEATPERIEDPHRDHRNVGSCGVTGEPGCQNPAVDITPDTFMINGISFPNTIQREDTVIHLEPGERIRLRILNAGTTWESIHTHGHDMLLTHVDGNPIPDSARYYMDTVPIAPASRVDVVLEGRAGNEGVWVVHSHIVNHVTNDQQYPGGFLTKIVYPGFEDDLTPFDGVELAGGQPYEAPLDIPGDYGDKTRRGIGTSTDVSEAWSFPVHLGCAVKSIWLGVSVDSASTATQGLNDLSVRITDEHGEEAANLAIGSTRYQEWRLQPDGETHLEAGNFTVTMTGRAVDSVAEMQVFVDYFDDLEELHEAGDPCAGDH